MFPFYLKERNPFRCKPSVFQRPASVCQGYSKRKRYSWTVQGRTGNGAEGSPVLRHLLSLVRGTQCADAWAEVDGRARRHREPRVRRHRGLPHVGVHHTVWRHQESLPGGLFRRIPRLSRLCSEVIQRRRSSYILHRMLSDLSEGFSRQRSDIHCVHTFIEILWAKLLKYVFIHWRSLVVFTFCKLLLLSMHKYGSVSGPPLI